MEEYKAQRLSYTELERRVREGLAGGGDGSNAPVQSVNGQKGDVVLTASDVGARPSTWTPSATEVGARPNTWTPSYTDVGAEKSGTAASAVSAHNTNTVAHNDIRLDLKALEERINAALDSADTDLDQLAEIVTYIKSNKSLIDAITTSKVSVSDIINNLTTNAENKPLSAAQGVALKALIDALGTAKLDASALTSAINTALSQAKASGEFDGTDGDDGVGISSIAKTGTSGLVDTYTITYTNGSKTTFTVTNGQNGSPGKDGTSVTVKNLETSNVSGAANKITFSDNTSINIYNGEDGVNGKSAYEYAKDGGYLGTEAEFTEDINPTNLKSELSQIETPKIVSSVAEMTDNLKHYVLDGYIYASKTVVTEGSKTYPNKFVPSTATLSSRFSGSSGSVSASDGAKGSFVTDFIAVKKLDENSSYIFESLEAKSPYNVRLNWEMPTHNDNKVVFYNSSKTRVGNNSLFTSSNSSISNGETIIDLKTIHTSSSVKPSSWDDVAYVRFQLFVNSTTTALTTEDIKNLTIKFDAIYEETQASTKQEFVNSGISYAPTFKTDIIGVLGEGNVIYLSDNLPSGTYTLKYPDKDYATVGTIIK